MTSLNFIKFHRFKVMVFVLIYTSRDGIVKLSVEIRFVMPLLRMRKRLPVAHWKYIRYDSITLHENDVNMSITTLSLQLSSFVYAIPFLLKPPLLAVHPSPSYQDEIFFQNSC